MKEKIASYLLNLALAFLAVYFKNLDAVLFAAVLAFVLVVVDFITGVSASWFVDHVGIQSKKLRWSFAKLAVYVVALAATLFVGVMLHLVAHFMNSKDNSEVLLLALACVKYEAYVICWVEIVSNLENCLRIWPDNKFLKYIHFVVSVDFVKKIPRLADALKEKEVKP